MIKPATATPPARQQGPHVAWQADIQNEGWRHELGRLTALALPLLPCGAGAEQKAPIDATTGKLLEGWQTAAFSAEKVAAMPPCVRSVGFRTGSGVLCLDIDGATAVELCQVHGCDPANADTWQVHRTTEPARLKVIWLLNSDQAEQLGQVSGKAQTRLPEKNKSGEVHRKGEAVEVFHHRGRQVIVLGDHVPSSGAYVWPDGRGPEALAPIPPHWLELVQAVAGGQLGIRTTVAPRKVTSKGSSRSSSEWEAIGSREAPCPICRRNTTAYCSRHRVSRTIRCFNGSTFSPHHDHSLSRLGVIVTGTDGVPYGYCGDEQQSNGDTFSTFRVHQERPNAPDGVDGFQVLNGEQQQQPAGGQQEPRKPCRDLSPQEKLSALRGHADGLLAHGVPFADRLPLMRARAESLNVTLRDPELQRFLWDARRAAAGTIEPLGPGDQIDLSPSTWHWEGVVMAGCFNLLVALPKVGKTSLLLAMLGAWHRGERSFVGLDLVGPCPPVLIVGTDQPSQDWGRMLQQVELLGENNKIKEPIVGLFHKGRPLHLDPEGIERIASYAADHRGLLVVLDSIAACTGPLGLDENSAEIVEPVNDLLEAIEPHGATLVAIHHSSKGRAGESATMASRGSTALPAAASQIISLSRVASALAGPKDPRIVLKTEGRGGQPQELLIERTDLGWISHGSAEAVALAKQMEEVERKLGERQEEALEYVRERWAEGKRTDAATLAPLMGNGADRERSARRTLDQLVRKGLLSSAMENHETGRRKFFWPVGVKPDRTPSRGGLDNPSDLSDVSDPVREAIGPDLLGCKGSDTSDGKVQLQRPTREGVRPPRQRLNGAPDDLKSWWRGGCPSDQLPVPLGIKTGPIGSGFDAMADEDDPHWGPRPSGEVA